MKDMRELPLERPQPGTAAQSFKGSAFLQLRCCAACTLRQAISPASCSGAGDRKGSLFLPLGTFWVPVLVLLCVALYVNKEHQLACPACSLKRSAEPAGYISEGKVVIGWLVAGI